MRTLLTFILSFYCINIYCQEIDSTFSGIKNFFDEHGSLQSTISYINGIENGEIIRYNLNREIEYIGLLIEGKRHGTNIFYDFYDKESYIIINYKNGVLSGEWIHKTKNSKTRGFYKENEKDGYWFYYLNNNLVRIENYSNGELLFEKDFKP